MLSLVVAASLAAAPPAAALGCKPKQCSFTAHPAGAAGTVWQVTRLGVRTADDTTCQEDLQDWWLVGPDASKPAQKLLQVCNDGYGASGVGEDTIEVKGATFTHSRSGGSAWRWASKTVVQLAPLAVASEESSSFHATSPNLGSNSAWSWTKFEGTWSDDVAPCGQDGAPNPEADAVAVKGNLVPLLALPADFVSGGWKTTALGACSAAGSFVTFGRQSGAADASLRVVAHGTGEQDRVLFLEVKDDTLVERAAKWTLADHVELWLSDESDPWQQCAGKKGGVQWGVALDGTVNDGFGARKELKLRAEVARGDGVVRLKLTLPAVSWQRVSVVYSDSDDGQKQKALLATSALKFASEVTFGRWQQVAPTAAACVVEGGALLPVSRRTYTPAQPVLE